MSKQSSDSPPEQRSYSVDEMMSRLRDGDREKREQEEGELVTRPDGTQVVRVRRRKRRTKQPEVEARKRKTKSRKIVIPFMIVVVVAAAVAALLLVSKYNSRGFQDEFEDGLEALMGSKISLERLAVTPIKVRAATMRSEWPEGWMMEVLELSGIEADLKLSGFLTGSWKGDQIRATRGMLQLGTGRGGVPSVPGAAGTSPLTYSEIRCQFLDVRFGDEKTSGALLKNTEATLLTPEDGPLQVRFRGGNLIIAGWDPMKVDLGTGKLTNSGFELVSFRSSPKGSGGERQGEMNLTTAAPVQPGQPVQMNLQMTSFPLENLLGPQLGRIFSGLVDSQEGSIVFGNEGLPRADVEVEFSGDTGHMEGMPFLENLRSILGKTDYGRPEFDSMKGVFHQRSSGETSLQGLVLESKGQMKVLGTLTLGADDALSGVLEIGVAEDKVITATGRKRNEVFGDPKGGYCWVTLTISGSADDPEDDFKILLQKSAKEVYERRDSTSGGNRFDELTRPR